MKWIVATLVVALWWYLRRTIRAGKVCARVSAHPIEETPEYRYHRTSVYVCIGLLVLLVCLIEFVIVASSVGNQELIWWNWVFYPHLTLVGMFTLCFVLALIFTGKRRPDYHRRFVYPAQYLYQPLALTGVCLLFPELVNWILVGSGFLAGALLVIFHPALVWLGLA